MDSSPRTKGPLRPEASDPVSQPLLRASGQWVQGSPEAAGPIRPQVSRVPPGTLRPDQTRGLRDPRALGAPPSPSTGWGGSGSQRDLGHSPPLGLRWEPEPEAPSPSQARPALAPPRPLSSGSPDASAHSYLLCPLLPPGHLPGLWWDSCRYT